MSGSLEQLKARLNLQWQNSRSKYYLDALVAAWVDRAKLGEEQRNQQELDFLPAALEVLERPPSPIGKLLGRVIIAFVVIGITWACIGQIDITAVAEGKIISSSRIKKIQPLEKGVVKAIYVKEGQFVNAGEPLLELDQTLTAAEQIRISQELHFAQLNRLRQKAFLEALVKPLSQPELITLPTVLITEAETLTQQQLLRQQWLDYQSRLKSLEHQKDERIANAQANEAQIEQLEQTLPLITRRASALKKLVDKKLSPEMAYLEVEELRIQQQQTLAVYQAQRQQNNSSIESIVQQLITLKAETVSKTLTQVDEYQRQEQALVQELAKARDLNERQILYAPVDGHVQQLAANTVGGVVTEAEVLMHVVPNNDYLEVEAVLENKDIGFVYAGLPAEIKVNTFNFTKYGVVDAEVVGVTADAVVDEVKGLVYTLRLKMHANVMHINGRDVALLPGMSVSAEVKTGKRRLIEYVLSPLLRKADESVGER